MVPVVISGHDHYPWGYVRLAFFRLFLLCWCDIRVGCALWAPSRCSWSVLPCFRVLGCRSVPLVPLMASTTPVPVAVLMFSSLLGRGGLGLFSMIPLYAKA